MLLHVTKQKLVVVVYYKEKQYAFVFILFMFYGEEQPRISLTRLEKSIFTQEHKKKEFLTCQRKNIYLSVKIILKSQIKILISIFNYKILIKLIT